MITSKDEVMDRNKKYEILQDISQAEGLEIICTTDSVSGYPQHLDHALIGFGSYGQAEELAERHDMAVYQYDRRDGWNLWHRGGRMFGPLEISADDYGADYNELNKHALSSFFRVEVAAYLKEFDDIESLMYFLEGRQEIELALRDMEEDEIVITYCSRYYETVKKHPMKWAHDSNTIAVGVELIG